MSGSVVREAIQSHGQSALTAENGAIFHGMSRLVTQPEFSTTNNIQEKVNSFLSQNINSFAIRGEIILEKKKFEQYQKELDQKLNHQSHSS